MSVFGGVSKGERNRIKIRVRAAMASQAQLEGRFLGGRAPYGYKLADAGPHPNPAKAADGKRLHQLANDEPAAAVVRRIFDELLAGAGIKTIAEHLTSDGIACPSAHDPVRSQHRCGIAWSGSAVRVILANPRYTGRQVWNRQRTDEVLIDVRDVALGHTQRMRWNHQDQWVWSEAIAHPPIIDEANFRLAAEVLAARSAGPPVHRPHRSRRSGQHRPMDHRSRAGRLKLQARARSAALLRLAHPGSGPARPATGENARHRSAVAVLSDLTLRSRRRGTAGKLRCSRGAGRRLTGLVTARCPPAGTSVASMAGTSDGGGW